MGPFFPLMLSANSFFALASMELVSQQTQALISPLTSCHLCLVCNLVFIHILLLFLWSLSVSDIIVDCDHASHLQRFGFAAFTRCATHVYVMQIWFGSELQYDNRCLLCWTAKIQTVLQKTSIQMFRQMLIRSLVAVVRLVKVPNP